MIHYSCQEIRSLASPAMILASDQTVRLGDLGDASRCTRSLGIDRLRQTLYVCLSCPDRVRRLLCAGCAHARHQGHSLQSLGMQRAACEADAVDSAIRDPDNHHRLGRFCWCDSPSAPPMGTGEGGTEGEGEGEGGESGDDAETVMWQCLVCEDWFHLACIATELPWITADTGGDFVCRSCIARHPILSGCCRTGSGECVPLSRLLPEGFSGTPCRCSECDAHVRRELPFLHPASPPYVELDGEADRGASLDDPSWPDKPALLETIYGYHRLKARLKGFLDALPAGHIVTEDDINQFFSRLA